MSVLYGKFIVNISYYVYLRFGEKAFMAIYCLSQNCDVALDGIMVNGISVK